ncbi:Uncharacterised protein [Yersinia pseudotuberculosis]|nr:Uncharacterised protein [Yersinia pseudotuberculosis]
MTESDWLIICAFICSVIYAGIEMLGEADDNRQAKE